MEIAVDAFWATTTPSVDWDVPVNNKIKMHMEKSVTDTDNDEERGEEFVTNHEIIHNRRNDTDMGASTTNSKPIAIMSRNEMETNRIEQSHPVLPPPSSKIADQNEVESNSIQIDDIEGILTINEEDIQSADSDMDLIEKEIHLLDNYNNISSSHQRCI